MSVACCSMLAAFLVVLIQNTAKQQSFMERYCKIWGYSQSE